MQEQKVIDYLMNQKFSELSLFINNVCNLRCKHCYVGAKDIEEDVDLNRWKSVINECIANNVKIIGIVGKEPLLTPSKTFSLINYIKQKSPNIIVGFVTNGILLPKYSNIISKIDMDYIDISIDGLEREHDFIRGGGNFQKTLNGIKSLIKSGFSKDKIFLSITLTNRANLKKIISFFDKEGLTNFVISPYMLLPHNSGELVTNEISFFEKFVKESKELQTKNKINLLVKADYNNLPLVKYFINKKYIDLENLKYDKERNIIFTEHNINNISIYFNFLPFSTELVREIRITSDGYVLSCLDQGYPDYRERSIGNIKHNSLIDILSRKESKEIIKKRINENVKEIKEVFY